MSLDAPRLDKMIHTPSAKKEYHFAATAEHYAEVVCAETIEEAETIYHKVKRPIVSPEPAADSEQLSTPDTEQVEEAKG